MTSNISFAQHAYAIEEQKIVIEEQFQELIPMLQHIVQNAGMLLEVRNCSIALLDSSGTALVTLAALQRNERKLKHTRFRMNEGVAGWVAQHKESLVINDTSLDPRFKRLGHTPIGSIMCVPLIENGIFMGTLTATSAETEAFDSKKAQMMTVFADQARLTIVHARQAEIAQRQAQQLQAILTASSDGIALLTPNGYFIDANPAFGHVFGIEPTRIVGMSCMELFAGDQEEQGPARVCQALRSEEPLPYIEIDLAIGGTFRSIGLSITPVKTARLVLHLLVTRDITAIREVTRMKSQFISMITHELRSPLNAINGYLDLALEGIAGELNEQLHEFLLRARTGSEHLYALLEDLLLISRADAGQWRLSRELIDLPEVIENAVEELELTASDNGVAIKTTISGGREQVGALYADPIRLQQVLRNLLSNALRYTAAGGQITIGTQVVANTYHGIAPEHSHVLLLQVSDTGEGIAPEYLDRIFERYYQIPGPSMSRKGQGLGLAIVKMVVEAHGGLVTVESTLNQGSTFTCILPCLLS